MSTRSVEDIARDAFLAEAETLAQLLQHPGWAVYENLLGKMRLDVVELMAKSTRMRQVVGYQGAAAVLAELIERPHQIVEAAKSMIEDESRRRQEVRSALDLMAHGGEDDL